MFAKWEQYVSTSFVMNALKSSNLISFFSSLPIFGAQFFSGDQSTLVGANYSLILFCYWAEATLNDSKFWANFSIRSVVLSSF